MTIKKSLSSSGSENKSKSHETYAQLQRPKFGDTCPLTRQAVARVMGVEARQFAAGCCELELGEG